MYRWVFFWFTRVHIAVKPSQAENLYDFANILIPINMYRVSVNFLQRRHDCWFMLNMFIGWTASISQIWRCCLYHGHRYWACVLSFNKPWNNRQSQFSHTDRTVCRGCGWVNFDTFSYEDRLCHGLMALIDLHHATTTLRQSWSDILDLRIDDVTRQGRRSIGSSVDGAIYCPYCFPLMTLY